MLTLVKNMILGKISISHHLIVCLSQKNWNVHVNHSKTRKVYTEDDKA